MIGVLLLAHGNLAQEFKNVGEHVMGPQEHLLAFDVNNEEDFTQKRQQLSECVQSLDQGKGVIVLTDMFGGSPSNLALSLLDLPNVEVIAGTNVPMLIKLISIRDKRSLKACTEEVQASGRQYINVASHFLAASHA